MEKYILLTKLNPEIMSSPAKLEDIENKITKKIHKECKDVKWIKNYSIFGPYDYLDIFEAPNNQEAFKLSILIRSFGHASTEIWPITSSKRFNEYITDFDKEVEKETIEKNVLEELVDEVGDESFPASDPPAWTSSCTG